MLLFLLLLAALAEAVLTQGNADLVEVECASAAQAWQGCAWLGYRLAALSSQVMLKTNALAGLLRWKVVSNSSGLRQHEAQALLNDAKHINQFFDLQFVPIILIT